MLQPYRVIALLGLFVTSASYAGYTGVAVSTENYQEFTHTGADPFVERNTVIVSGLLGYTKSASVNLNYQGELALGIGTHRSAKILQSQKYTKFNDLVTTNNLFTVSKHLGQFEPEIGINLYGEYMKSDDRLQAEIDAVAGIAYRPNDEVTLGLRYQKPLTNEYFYHKFNITQTTGESYQMYAEKRGKHNTLNGVAISYRQFKAGEKIPYQIYSVQEPDSKAVMLKIYKKYL